MGLCFEYIHIYPWLEILVLKTLCISIKFPRFAAMLGTFTSFWTTNFKNAVRRIGIITPLLWRDVNVAHYEGTGGKITENISFVWYQIYYIQTEDIYANIYSVRYSWWDQLITMYYKLILTLIKTWNHSLALGMCVSIFESVFFKLILRIATLSTSCKIGLRWVLKNATDDKSKLVEVI